MVYTPDNWIIVKVKYQKEIIYKIFASWYGSYLSGSSWQVNSGIKSFEETKDYYEFYGFSGSIYRCYKNLEGFSGYGASVFNNLQQSILPAKMTKVSLKTFRKNFNEQP